MARVFTLASSSSGNCTYIFSQGKSLLIDAGISASRIVSSINEKNEDIDSLCAILITHDHIDHRKGLEVFLKKHPLPVYATAPVIEYLRNIIKTEIDFREIQPFELFETAGMRILPVPTSHDAEGSVCYRIETPDEHLISYATDLGTVTEDVENSLLGSDMVVLESNHDATLLQIGPYPMMLKRRISSPLGHLSNIQAAVFANKLYQSGTRHFLLAHLSKENNNPFLAKQVIVDELSKDGSREGYDFEVDVAKYDEPSKTIIV